MCPHLRTILTKRELPTGNQTLTWDLWNRLSTVVTPTGTTRYVYDADSPTQTDFPIRNRGRCAGPPWRRENRPAFVRDAEHTVMPIELVDQDGVGDH
jgi:YD repeat-containing protein